MSKPKTKTQLDPARSIIDLLGGLSAAADALGTNTTMIQRWRWAQDEGGTGGYIPRWWRDKIIAAADAKGITIAPAAFIDTSAASD